MIAAHPTCYQERGDQIRSRHFSVGCMRSVSFSAKPCVGDADAFFCIDIVFDALLLAPAVVCWIDGAAAVPAYRVPKVNAAKIRIIYILSIKQNPQKLVSQSVNQSANQASVTERTMCTCKTPVFAAL